MNKFFCDTFLELGLCSSFYGNELIFFISFIFICKVILNLTTQINQLRFNPSGEILAMSSELKVRCIFSWQPFLSHIVLNADN